MKDIFKLGKPEFVGKIPSRTELPVLPADDPTKEIGFPIHMVNGTDCYRPPVGSPSWPATTLEDCRTIGVDENLVTTEDGLIEGEELLIQDLFGLHGCKVAIHSEDGAPYGMSHSGNMMYMLDFVDDRGEGHPARWVCTGSANLRALRGLRDKKLTPAP